MDEIHWLILKVTWQVETWQLLEHLKGSDLVEAMQGAKLNGATFLDAFWSALEKLKASEPAVAVPTAQMIDGILLKRGERFELRQPQLFLRSGAPNPWVTISAKDLDGKARRLIAESLAGADELLSLRRRGAVGWLLCLPRPGPVVTVGR